VTNLENLVAMGYLMSGEKIDWKIRPKESTVIKTLETWIRKVIKNLQEKQS
jgi:hypothetical protein